MNKKDNQTKESTPVPIVFLIATTCYRPTTMQGCRKQRGGGLGFFSPPPPQVFGRTLNPISNKGTDYTNHSTTSPPGFSDLTTALLYISSVLLCLMTLFLMQSCRGRSKSFYYVLTFGSRNLVVCWSEGQRLKDSLNPIHTIST